MANNESTAVNDLIKIATSQKPLTPDPSDDLMFSIPHNARASRMRTGMQPSTATAQVEALPRGRAPHGTQQNASVSVPPPVRTRAPSAPPPMPAVARTSSRSIAVPPPMPGDARVSSRSISVPPPMPAVARAMTPADVPAVARTMTPTTNDVARTSSRSIAVPPPPPTASRTITVPPVPPAIMRGMVAVSVVDDQTAPSSLQFADGSVDVSMDGSTDEPIASRVTRPSLPPPGRQTQAASVPSLPSLSRTLPALAARTSSPNVPLPSGPRTTTLAPVVVPVAAPAPAAIDMTGSPWFEESRTVDRVSSPFVPETLAVEGTAQVARPRTKLEWLAKLAPVMGIAIIVGLCVGGFVVFDGAGGKKRSAPPAATAAPVAAIESGQTADQAAVIPAAAPDAIAPTDVAPAAVTPPNLATAVAAEPAAEPAAAVPAEPAPAGNVIVTSEPADVPAATVTTPNVATPTPAVAPAATPAVAVPSIAAAAVTAKRAQLVDIRIDSKPAGATVMLVDRGKTTFLGTTPISTALDPSRTYDVVLTHGTRPAVREHLDPKTTQRLAVEISRHRARTEVARVVATPAPAAPPVKVAKAAPVKVAKLAKIVEPVWDAPATSAKPAKIETTESAKTETPVAKKAVTGEGLLMISSKPPCEIHIDGKATGLMTPQRAMKLPAGKHTITLVNPAENLKKTVAVSISPDAPTKVIQDLMKP